MDYPRSLCMRSSLHPHPRAPLPYRIASHGFRYTHRLILSQCWERGDTRSQSSGTFSQYMDVYGPSDGNSYFPLPAFPLTMVIVSGHYGEMRLGEDQGEGLLESV